MVDNRDIEEARQAYQEYLKSFQSPQVETTPSETSFGEDLATGLESVGRAASLGLTKPINAAIDSFVWNPEKSFDQAMQDETQRIKAQEEASPLSSGIGTLIGSIAGPTPFKGTGLVKNMLSGAATGAISEGVSNADLGSGLKGAALGAGGGAALTGLGKLLGSVGDVGMQAAIGKRNYTPGLGKRLADEGLVGTQGMMRGQVERGLANRGQEIGALAASIPEIQGAPVRQAIQEVASSVKLPDGSVRLGDIADVDLANRLAADIPETMTGAYAAARRRAAGASGFNKSGAPRTSFESNLDRAEQGALSRALKEAFQGPNPDAMREADAAYSALIKARKPLNSEDVIPKSLFGALTTPINAVGGALPLSSASRASLFGERVLDKNSPDLLKTLFNYNRD